MRAIDRKMLRDLWGMRGPALAIALVIVSGVATFVTMTATMANMASVMAVRQRRAIGYAIPRRIDIGLRAPRDSHRPMTP